MCRNMILLLALVVSTSSLNTSLDISTNGTVIPKSSDENFQPSTEVNTKICILPPYPENGKYLVINQRDARPGDVFKELVLISYTTDANNAIVDVTYNNCSFGVWYSKLLNNKSDKCSPLYSDDVFEKSWVPAHNPYLSDGKNYTLCILPPYPHFGDYIVLNATRTKPGDTLDTIKTIRYITYRSGVVAEVTHHTCSYGNWSSILLSSSDKCSSLSSVNRIESNVCRLPPYPNNGRYVVVNNPNFDPGAVLDHFYLEYKCDDGYEFVGDKSVYCFNGIQSSGNASCIKSCRLDPNPSVEYLCHVPGSSGGTRPCALHEPHGTIVTPTCKSPTYYSAQFLRYMTCFDGEWNYVAECLAVCGTTIPKGETLVAGGRASERGEVPWHVGIYNKEDTFYKHHCGGSIISPTLIVTAAHCFWSDKDRVKLPASQFAVAAGKLYKDWNDKRDDMAEKRNIQNIEIPERFRGSQTNYQDDVAVAVLADPLVYDVHIRPVCMDFDTLFDRKQLAVGNLGKVAGWGLVDGDGSKAHVLQVIDLPYIDINQCLNNAPFYFRQYITSDKICAGYTNGTALCKGDSGGGLAFPELFGGEKRYFLRGVVSTTPNNEMSCNVFAVTSFTQIWRHEHFIKQNYLET